MPIAGASEKLPGQFYDKGGMYFNVMHPDFGATGAAVADDTAAIQAAIDACSAAGGGYVAFPPGRYLVSSRIKIKLGVRLVGASMGFLGLVGWPGTTLVLAAGYADSAVVSFYAYEDNGVFFLGNCGAENLVVDYTNAPSCGAVAFDLKSVSNCGPWRNLRTFRQDVGAALRLGISQTANAQPCEGLTFYDAIFTDSATVDPADTGAVVVLGGARGAATSTLLAAEISFIGCKIGRRNNAGVAVAGTKAVLVDTGCAGINFVATAITGRERGIAIANSDGAHGAKPVYINTFGCTFEGWRYGVAIDGTAGQANPQFITCTNDRFVAGSQCGVDPRNYYVDRADNCTIAPTEGAPGSGVVVEFTANAQQCVAYVAPLVVVNASATCAAIGHDGANQRIGTGAEATVKSIVNGGAGAYVGYEMRRQNATVGVVQVSDARRAGELQLATDLAIVGVARGGQFIGADNNQLLGAARGAAVAAVASPNATDLPSAITLANELKAQFNALRATLSATAGGHGLIP